MDIKSIENSIKTSLTQKRMYAKKIADEYLEKCLEISEFKEVYEKYQDLRITYSKNLANNKLDECAKNKNQLKELKEKMQKIMQQNNIDAKLLKPKYECDKCSDMGYVDGEKCSCFKRELSNKLIEASGLNKSKLPKFDDINFNLVPDQKQRENLQKIASLLKTFCDKIFQTRIDTILLSGEVGVGKTFLMECVVSELIEKGTFVYYETAFAMNQNLLKIHCGTMEEKERLNDYLTCDVLCIDDLGTENIIKNVTVEYLYSILNERMVNNKKTIITTNLNFIQLNERYGERICSRLAESSRCFKVDIKGADIRLS